MYQDNTSLCSVKVLIIRTLLSIRVSLKIVALLYTRMKWIILLMCDYGMSMCVKHNPLDSNML